jgi:hypothetical protein
LRSSTSAEHHPCSLVPAEEEPGEHQQPSAAGDEVRKVHSGLQDLPEDPALWQG